MATQKYLRVNLIPGKFFACTQPHCHWRCITPKSGLATAGRCSPRPPRLSTNPNVDYGMDRAGLRTGHVVNTYVPAALLVRRVGAFDADARMLGTHGRPAAAGRVPAAGGLGGRQLLRQAFWARRKWQTPSAGASIPWRSGRLRTNPSPNIAGLYRVLKGLLALGPDVATPAQRADWNRPCLANCRRCPRRASGPFT